MRYFSGDGVVKNVPEDKAAVFEVPLRVLFVSPAHLDLRYSQLVLENTSESSEEGDLYALQLQKDTNTDGLKVYVGGQTLNGIMYFPHFPFGGTKVVVEVFRGPNMYDYTSQPITLIWSTGCQDDIIISFIELKPQFLKPCAKVEFHSTNVTFAITPSS